MPFTSPSNNFIWGLSKQTNESTVATTEEYGSPVYSGRSMPVQSINRVEITDALSIIGDSYKQGDEHWETDVTVPAFAPMLGRILTGLWGTDTPSGSGPYTHVFTGLGSAAPWFTTYNTDLLAGSVEETFEAGQCSGISFASDDTGGPMRVNCRMVGKRPTVASYTNATAQALADGYFTASGGTLQYDVDSGSPVTETNIQSFTLNVDRPVTPVATADSVSVGYLAVGLVDPNISMTLLMDDFDAYRATFFGAIAGTAPSATLVYGSVTLNFVHTVQAGWSFSLVMPRVVLQAEPPQPDPSAAPLTVTINGLIQKPAAGNHVQPTLVNAVSSAY